MALPITGATGERAELEVTPACNQFNIVTDDQILDKDDPVNNFNVSGKQAGAVFIMDTAGVMEFVVAQGKTDVATWMTMGTTPVAITPV